MRSLRPTESTDEPETELETWYRYPDRLDRPWLRVNFVTSLDGAVTVQGRSRGLSDPDDVRVFGLIRDLSDVILVGGGTAMVEGYRGVRRTEVRSGRRLRLGLSEVPPVAVVTGHCSLPPDSPLVVDTLVPPIVFTTPAAPAERRKALADAGADVVVTGDERVDLTAMVAALDERGLRRIGCEGGPTLFGHLIADDLVDELCLTLSPLLTSGDADRIARGPRVDQPRRMRLLAALQNDDSMLMLRYGRAA